jgi:hypothetical protein
MNTTRTVILSAVFVLLTAAAQGQPPRTQSIPAQERAAIMNALRVPVEKDLKQKITFVVRHLGVKRDWAFVSGEPQTPAGKRPNLKGTAWEDSPDLFDDNFFGLLRKQRGKWRVVTHALGCTDVCYLDWSSQYKAPFEIFGLPEGAR